MEMLRDDGTVMPPLPVTFQEGIRGRWGTLGVGTTTFFPPLPHREPVPCQGGQPVAGGTKAGDDELSSHDN